MVEAAKTLGQLFGLGGIVYGVALIYLPAAIILGSAVLLVLCLEIDITRRRAR